MSLAEQVVVLGGSWVEQRKNFGKTEILMCKQPVDVTKPAVIAEIGVVTPFTIMGRSGTLVVTSKAFWIGSAMVTWAEKHEELEASVDYHLVCYEDSTKSSGYIYVAQESNGVIHVC
ncbi:hypothetical protein HJ184_09095 [Vibrio parahaemolyticus]|nr:hypothetical protein [Vibrio parahaemolyticus]